MWRRFRPYNFKFHIIFLLYVLFIKFIINYNIYPFSICSGPLTTDVTISFIKQHPSLLEILPSRNVTFGPTRPQKQTLKLLGKKPGHLNIEAEIKPDILE